MSDKKMNFEERLNKLEAMVDRFDDSELELDDGIKLFEDGLAITKECLKELAEAKGKISIIKQEMDRLIDEPFGKD